MMSMDQVKWLDVAKLTLDAKRASRVGSTALEEAVRLFELFFVRSLSVKASRIGKLPFCHCVRFSTVCAELEKSSTLVHSF